MSWWRRVFARARLERELDAELRDHYDRLVRDFSSQGLEPAEARRRATLELGGFDQMKEACRDARGTRWVEEIWQDTRYGVRGMRAHPGFTAVAVLTLALGVGANLMVFNIFDALLLRPLPVPNPSELVTFSRWVGSRSSGDSFSYPHIRALAERTDLFSTLCGLGSDTIYVGPLESLEAAGAAWVSGRYFDTLQLTPFAGRLLNMADDELGAPAAAVISHGYWMRQFGGNRSIVGTPMIIEGQPVPIVGITPPGFEGATIGERADITLAISARH